VDDELVELEENAKDYFTKEEANESKPEVKPTPEESQELDSEFEEASEETLEYELDLESEFDDHSAPESESEVDEESPNEETELSINLELAPGDELKEVDLIETDESFDFSDGLVVDPGQILINDDEVGDRLNDLFGQDEVIHEDNIEQTPKGSDTKHHVELVEHDNSDQKNDVIQEISNVVSELAILKEDYDLGGARVLFRDSDGEEKKYFELSKEEKALEKKEIDNMTKKERSIYMQKNALRLKKKPSR